MVRLVDSSGATVANYAYDPIIKRFINADSYASTGQGFLGYNTFAYCGNNPVRRIDQSGLWWGQDLWNWVCDTAEDAVNAIGEAVTVAADGIATAAKDVYSYITNEDEVVVLESPLPLAFYKGRLVIKTGLIGENAFSFGVMVIGTGNVNDPAGNGINTVKHEYGHTVQFEEYGLFGYTAFVAIPSVMGYIESTKRPFPDYYNQPWERQADIYGEVTRATHSTSSAANAAKYTKATLAISYLLHLLMPY